MTDSSPVALYGAAQTDSGDTTQDSGGAVPLYGAAQSDAGGD
jgi:hypothetical protein